MNNIPREISESPKVDLDIKSTDPEMAEAINNFLKEKSEQTPGAPEQPAERPKNVHLPANNDFDIPVPQDVMVSEALVDAAAVEVTDEERNLFLKATLSETEELFRLPISLYGGKFIVELRSRTHFEQRRVFDALQYDQAHGTLSKEDLALQITRFQHYVAALMVERINGKLFSELHLVPGEPIELHAKKLREFAEANFDKMSQIKVTSIINAMRVFEAKCQRMSTEANNPNFWKPPGTVASSS